MDKKHKHEPAAPNPDPLPAQPPPASAEGQPEEGIETPEQAQIRTLIADKENLLDRLARLSADYLNYQKRIQRDINENRDFANAGLMKDMLAVLDDLERAIQAAATDHATDPLFHGVKLVYDKALTVLGRHGLKRIVADGQPFDPARHEAVMQQPSETHTVPTVLQQVTSGYELKGRVIRPAKVVVSALVAKR